VSRSLVVCLAALLLCACSHEKSGSDDPPPAPQPLVSPSWTDADRSAAIAAGENAIASHQCTRCHTIGELPGAGRPYDCVSCHVFIKGLKPGQKLYEKIAAGNGVAILDRYIRNIQHLLEVPDLTGIARRVRPQWIAGYLASPHDLRPLLDASMIRNKLSADEIQTLVRYFTASADAPDPYAAGYVAPAPLPRPDAAGLARGKELFSQRGCPGCHTFGNQDFGVSADTLEKARSLALMAPDLRWVRERTRPDVIVDWILDPASIKPGTKMAKMVVSRQEAELIGGYLMYGDPGPLEKPADAEALMTLPPAADRKVGWAEVKGKVLGVVCVHCHMEDFEKDTGPGNKGGFGYAGIGLGFRTYEHTVWGAIDPTTGERYSVLVPRPGETLPPILDAMLRRRVENRRDLTAPFHDTTLVDYGDGRLGMPLGLPAMNDEQLGILRAWIEQGCPGPTGVTGRPDKDDGFLVPDGPIAKNQGCELRAPADPPPKWSIRAIRARAAAKKKTK